MTADVKRGERGSDAYRDLATGYDDLMDGSAYYRNIRYAESMLLAEALSLQKHHAVLDLGCGTGFAASQVASRGIRVVGVDPSEEMLRVAQDRLSRWKDLVRLVVGKAERLPTLEEKFDLVVAFGSILNHVDDWNGLCSGIRERTRHGAFILMTVDNLLGADAFGWALHSLLAGQAGGAVDLAKRVTAAVRGKPHFNEWPLRSPRGTATVHLKYDRPGRVEAVLARHGFKIIKAQGANLLGSFNPRTILSCDGIDEVGQVAPLSWLDKCDHRLGRVLWRMAGSYVLWCRRQ